MADNEIRLNVTAVESKPLNVCVEQVPMNPVNVDNTYKGIDYNLLKNKPSIDGVTLEGDKTTAEVIGFDKEYVDEAILTTNAKIDSVEQDLSDRINAVSTDNFYTKEEIDNKVIVIEADIDANADAIQKTRSDFMESDSELQQQINAHANELTTQKNDIDELGDQVAGIESKIPEGTSDTNPLINKQQLLDEEMDLREDMMESDSELQTQINALAEAIQGGGGGSVPDNVYTQDNLIAGENVTFTEVPPEGGIDEHTLACWHFDGDKIDVVNGLEFYGQDPTIDTTQSKFGTGSLKTLERRYYWSASNTRYGVNVSSLSLTTQSNITIDFWLQLNYRTSSSYVGTAPEYMAFNDPAGGLGIRWDWDDANKIIKFKDIQSSEYSADIQLNSYGEWHHVAYVHKGVEKKSFIYFDGKMIKESSTSALTTNSLTMFNFWRNQENYQPVNSIDEARISDIVRYDEDFTPPTEPYKLATGPSKTAVNAIVAVPTKTSELENDSGFLTGLPDGVFTKDTLLGGKDIEIIPEPVEGGIDEYTLGVGHFEGTSAGENAVEGKDALRVSSGSLISDYSKFGTKCVYAPKIAYANTGFTEDSDWTIDAWVRFYAISDGWTAQMGIGIGDYESYNLDVKLDPYNSKIYIFTDVSHSVGTEKASATIPTIEINTWYHFAAEKHGNTITGYLDGNPVVSYTGSEIKNTGTYRYLWIHNNPSYADELRFSSIARYKGQTFTPPTEAYRKAEPTGNMVVNYTGEAGGAFDFQGTEAEFNAAVEAGKITDETVSLVTDDNSGELVVTKAELSAVDRSKADTALSNVLENIDYVVESKYPTADDPTWFRKYKSGWLEQGGLIPSQSWTANQTHTFELVKPFVDTNYTGFTTPSGTNLYAPTFTFTADTTTSWKSTQSAISNVAITCALNWRAEGRGA